MSFAFSVILLIAFSLVWIFFIQERLLRFLQRSWKRLWSSFHALTAPRGLGDEYVDELLYQLHDGDKSLALEMIADVGRRLADDVEMIRNHVELLKEKQARDRLSLAPGEWDAAVQKLADCVAVRDLWPGTGQREPGEIEMMLSRFRAHSRRRFPGSPGRPGFSFTGKDVDFLARRRVRMQGDGSTTPGQTLVEAMSAQIVGELMGPSGGDQYRAKKGTLRRMLAEQGMAVGDIDRTLATAFVYRVAFPEGNDVYNLFDTMRDLSLLADLSRSSSKAIRLKALIGLQNVGRRSIPCIVAMLDDEDQEVRDRAVKALARIEDRWEWSKVDCVEQWKAWWAKEQGIRSAVMPNADLRDGVLVS